MLEGKVAGHTGEWVRNNAAGGRKVSWWCPVCAEELWERQPEHVAEP